MDRAALAAIERARTAALPRRLSPQLPSPVAAPPAGPDWIHELKYDGYRMLVFIDRSAEPSVRFITRRGLDWTDRMVDLSRSFDALPCETALIDGEAAALDESGASSLSLMQEALKTSPERIVYFAFDLLHLDGVSLEDAALIDRKRALRAWLDGSPQSGRVQYSDHVLGAHGRALFDRALQLGLEGVVSKRASARYVQDRTQSWLKSKREDRERFMVAGYTEKTKGTLAALILAEEDEEGLRYVGRVGSGVSNALARELRQTFAPLLQPRPTIPDPPKLAAASGKPFWIPLGLFEAEVAYRGRSAASDSLLQPSLYKVEPTGAPPPVAPAEPAVPRIVTEEALATVRITSGERRLFEQDEAAAAPTKLDVALYYARVGDWMAPDLFERPVSFLRCKSGRREDCFFQRHRFNGLPDGVDQGEDGESDFLYIRTVEGFLGLPQFGVIEFHPWACRVDRLEQPDRLVLDLDPGPGVDWAGLLQAAVALRDRLSDLGLTAFVRTTGGGGLHLATALQRRHSWAEVKSFAQALARAAAQDAPRLFTTAPQTAARNNKIYLDVGRASRGASAVASYSLRAAPGLPAATPLSWEELLARRGKKPNFNYRSLIQRLETLASDPWGSLYDSAATITRKARREVGAGD